MRIEKRAWAPWVARPALWPRRVAEPTPGRERWLREPEPFEDRGAAESYPGATVLEDLAAGQDDMVVLRIVARYAVVRLVTLSAAGVLAGPKFATERRGALEHLALLPVHDWERHVLERLALLCRESPPPALAGAAATAAECAAKRGHLLGAFALYRAGYEVARDRGWWAEAALAAGGVARLAQLTEAPYSHRVWSWRCRVLEQRDRRAHEQAQEREQERQRELEREGERERARGSAGTSADPATE
jgi:hypothetical protein